jgi:hypothetical protein
MKVLLAETRSGFSYSKTIFKLNVIVFQLFTYYSRYAFIVYIHTEQKENMKLLNTK